MALSSFSPEEIVELAETYTGDLKSFAHESTPVMKRVFEKIEKERNENEYNRTQITAGHFEDMLKERKHN